MEKCKYNYTHIRIGYIFDCRISGLRKDAPNFKFLGKLLQVLHICRFSEYDDHWVHGVHVDKTKKTFDDLEKKEETE